MCGIVGYTGPREAYPIIIKGLQRLEYRGYDSTGVALLNSNGLNVFKKKGKVAELAETLVGENLHAHIGIGHTRWRHMVNQVTAMHIRMYPLVESWP